jgi:hypothetical protein
MAKRSEKNVLLCFEGIRTSANSPHTFSRISRKCGNTRTAHAVETCPKTKTREVNLWKNQLAITEKSLRLSIQELFMYALEAFIIEKLQNFNCQENDPTMSKEKLLYKCIHTLSILTILPTPREESSTAHSSPVSLTAIHFDTPPQCL